MLGRDTGDEGGAASDLNGWSRAGSGAEGGAEVGAEGGAKGGAKGGA